MHALKKTVSFAISLAFVCFCGCGEDGGKGPESPMPVDGSADSWQSPTYHGPLLIGGAENQGEFADHVYFHAWTFVLEGPADVSIRVVPKADNLDTVMYLYRRDPGQTSWGSYIARNDDHDGDLWSRLDESLEAGEYRIMIKGYKQSIRGRFVVLADCSGSGCPSGGDCSDEIESPDRETGPAPSCVEKTMEVLTSQVISTGSSWVHEDQRCDQPEMARRAWDYYYNYWDGIIGIEDFVYDEIEFNVEYSELEKGWLIGVDAGGDEDFMHYLFDARGELLVYYQSNQSPIVGWFCGGPDEEVDHELWPAEFCVGHYLRNMQAKDEAVEHSGSVLVQTANEMLPNLGYQAVLRYQEFEGLEDSDTVDYSYTQWEAADSGELMEITLQAEDKPEYSFTMGGGSWSTDMYFYIGPNGAIFDCQELR